MTELDMDTVANALRDEFVELMASGFVTISDLREGKFKRKIQMFSLTVGHLLDSSHYDFAVIKTGLGEPFGQIVFPPKAPFDTINGMSFFITLGIDGKWRAIASKGCEDDLFVESHLDLVQGFERFSELYFRVFLFASSECPI